MSHRVGNPEDRFSRVTAQYIDAAQYNAMNLDRYNIKKHNVSGIYHQKHSLIIINLNYLHILEGMDV